MRRWLVLILGVAFALVPVSALAGYTAGGNYDLRTKLEVSKDGSNWYNYDAETSAGGQTLDINAGDTVTFRIKMWNLGRGVASEIQMSVAATNPQWIETADIFNGSPATNGDIDDDHFYYSLVSLTAGSGVFGHEAVPTTKNAEAGTTNNECGSYTTKIKSDTPDLTLIQVTMAVTAAQQPVSKIKLLDRAYADSSATTVVRILVHNPSTAQTTALPATGKSAPAQSKSDTRALLIAGALVIISASWIFGRVRAIKAKNKA